VSLRLKILFYGVGIAMLAMMVLGTLMMGAYRNIYLDEAERRAKTFLAVIAVETTGHLASNRIEVMDGILSILMERNLEDLDIRFVAVLDKDRRVVGHTDQLQYGSFANDGFSKEAVAREDALVREVGLGDGENLLMVSIPVVSSVPGHPGIRWGTAIAGIGLERVRSNLMSLLLKAAGTILLVILIAATVASLFLDRQVVRPVLSITNAANDFTGGDKSTRVTVEGWNELAMLGHTFNEMAEQIQADTVRLEHEIKQRNEELEEANTQLKELVTTDALTGLFNFRHFDDTLDKEVWRSLRSERPLSLLMIDVDHFKNYNDEHGHPAGDKVLRTLASRIRERVRVTDVPCRYGGEEFTVILPGTGRADAMILADELRAIIEQHVFDGEEKSQPRGRLTISIGVATFPDNARDNKELLHAADKAMYRAKKAGRNRVESA